MSGSTLGCVTATEQPAPSRAVGVALDARDLTRCRRRIHLDHDPDAVGLPQALPDPAFEQRREDAARHRAGIAAVIRRETGCFVVPADADAERATAAAVAEGAALIWGALLPAARGTRRAPVELLVRVPEGGYVPVVVVRHRITDPGEGAVTSSPDAPVARARRPSIVRGASGRTRGISCGWPTCTGCCGRPGGRPSGPPRTAAGAG